jgi:hypothetical protein
MVPRARETYLTDRRCKADPRGRSGSTINGVNAGLDDRTSRDQVLPALLQASTR